MVWRAAGGGVGGVGAFVGCGGWRGRLAFTRQSVVRRFAAVWAGERGAVSACCRVVAQLICTGDSRRRAARPATRNRRAAGGFRWVEFPVPAGVVRSSERGL